MDIYKPRQERQKATARQNNRPRGAVLQPRQQKPENISLRFKKQLTDFFKNLERINAFLNPKVISLSALVLVASAVWWLVGELKSNMPIEHVSIQGDFQQLDRVLLEETLSPLVGSNYFDLRVSEIKASLHEFAWVQSVEVRKVWPASVEVIVVENRAIATWGQDSLVNEFGQVFTPKKINRSLLVGLPDLDGLNKQSDLVLNTYAKLSKMSEIYGLKINRFSLLANNYWELQLDTGVEVLIALGREERAMLTFLKAWEKELKHSAHTLARVDMRYSNGFSAQFTDKAVSADAEIKKSQTKVGNHHG